MNSNSKNKLRVLRPGDNVDIVSPAGPVLETHLHSGRDILHRWGLRTRVHPQALARRSPYEYLAGDDGTRLAALQECLDADDSEAILFTRGGYGSMRLLPDLDFAHFLKHPKPLVGFSDITALQLYISGVLGVPTFHGPVLKSLPRHQSQKREPQADSLRSLHDLLFGLKRAPWTMGGLSSIRSGSGRGRLLGGNLSLVVSLLGSPFCPSLEDVILVLEDVAEPDYRIDRMLTALRISTKAKGLAGLVFGDFRDCHGVYVTPDRFEHFLEQLGSEFSCPVARGLPCGHGHVNLTLPMGVEAELDATRGKLTIFDDPFQDLDP